MKTHFKKNGGFTLVELIVVIAILAILSAVAIPAYGGYIDKANRGADEALIAEVEQALLMGAYADLFAPGTVGAVALKVEADASCSQDDNNNDGLIDIDAMMEACFGANWEQTVQLKSDGFMGTEEALILQVVKNEANKEYFAAVPNSSFYQAEGSTTHLAEEVDKIAGAFSGLLNGQGYAFSAFWSDEFRYKVKDAELDYTTSSTQSNTAANLTVLAAAHTINDPNNAEIREEWMNSWSDDSIEIKADNGMDGYVGALVMKFAKYKAYHSYVNDPANTEQAKKVKRTVNTAYEDMVDALANLSPKEDFSYIDEFNKAIADFEKLVQGKDCYNTWQSGQAATDAKAFVGTMATINGLEDVYVSNDQAEMLNQSNAFANNGAADLLDTMIDYSKMTGDFKGDYVITLVIDENGTPHVTPSLQD